MKTTNEFNKKYFDYLSPGHYGLAISEQEVIDYLDEKFQELIKIPNFKYMQIKTKFNSVRFYSSLDNKINAGIERDIEEILKMN